MSLSRQALAVLAASMVATSACKPSDPNDPATHVSKLESKDVKVVSDAARELRKLKAQSAVPALVAALKHPDMGVRDEAAYALAEIGDKSAVPALIEAIDLNTTAKGSDRANSRYAFALGVLGDKAATPALIRMQEMARDPLVRDAAVTALGAIQDPAAVPTLIRLVRDDEALPLLTKHAIEGLGNMRAVEAVPALTRAMVLERKGVSFFLEASYALFQIGAPAAEALSKILTGEDKEFIAWAESKGRHPAGYLSKAAIVLSDLGEASAIPSLVKLLDWEDERGQDAMTYIVRKTAADSIGRLRAQEGSKSLTAQLSVAEANVRESFAIALAHLNAVDSLAKLEAGVKDPKSSWTARQASATGLALLGNAKNKPVLEALLAAESGDNAVKSCMAEPGSPTEMEAMKKDRCEREREARPKFVKAEIARIEAGEACGKDVQCWVGKLKDTEPKVRERAAYELGKLGDPAALDALVEAAKDKELVARRAAFIALDWFTKVEGAKTALAAKAAPLSAQLAEEKGSAYTVVVNEDLKRVVWKLQNLK